MVRAVTRQDRRHIKSCAGEAVGEDNGNVYDQMCENAKTYDSFMSPRVPRALNYYNALRVKLHLLISSTMSSFIPTDISSLPFQLHYTRSSLSGRVICGSTEFLSLTAAPLPGPW